MTLTQPPYEAHVANVASLSGPLNGTLELLKAASFTMFHSSWSCLAVGLILGQTFAPALAQIFETTTTSSLSEQSTSDLDVEGHIAKLEVARDSNSTDDIVLHYEGIEPGETVKNGTELRILPVGDSITVGYLSEDGNGYRAQLQADLSGKTTAKRFYCSESLIVFS